MTSLGPAIRSIDLCFETNDLAALTYLLPGPNILFTFGIFKYPFEIEKE